MWGQAQESGASSRVRGMGGLGGVSGGLFNSIRLPVLLFSDHVTRLGKGARLLHPTRWAALGCPTFVPGHSLPEPTDCRGGRHRDGRGQDSQCVEVPGRGVVGLREPRRQCSLSQQGRLRACGAAGSQTPCAWSRPARHTGPSQLQQEALEEVRTLALGTCAHFSKCSPPQGWLGGAPWQRSLGSFRVQTPGVRSRQSQWFSPQERPLRAAALSALSLPSSWARPIHAPPG